MKLDYLELTIDEEPLAADWNMAIDEALLSTSSSAILRCYHWQRPAISFGYFNEWELIAALYPDRPQVRRWTGGGIVEHGKDFTYSLVIPVAVRRTNTAELYQFVHTAVAHTLRKQGHTVIITDCPDTGEAVACFERAVAYDLKIGGNKVAGAAIRRNERGFLLQGSIQRVTIPARFETMLANALSAQILVRPLSLATKKLASHLVEEKYGSDAWNHRL